MALVLPTLRLWLLLVNVYGTFKAMKPPLQSQRSARSGHIPSARAIQLRKRELKSCLAVWVVWAMFSVMESALDSTIGLVMPFYNEFKCIVLLFLLVARSHGAEAIFLYIIHPLLRPYVPAIDDILASLHSLFDLLLLISFLPYEYVSDWWQKWNWPWAHESGLPKDEDHPPNDHGSGGEYLFEARRQLRPRNELQHLRMMEADRQSQAIFQDIEDVQDRVRNSIRSQPMNTRNTGRNHSARGRGVEHAQGPNAVSLRTRRRILEYPPRPIHDGPTRGPGSSTTGVHRVFHAGIDGLPQVPSAEPSPAFPNVPTTQPISLPPQQVVQASVPALQTLAGSGSSQHTIWYPSQTSLDVHRPSRQTPSPVYPPLPSAYPFTPRRSDPLPPAPRIVSPSNLAIPTPRRTSTGTAHSQSTLDSSVGINAFPGRANTAGPSRNTRSAEPSFLQRDAEKQGPIHVDDFFGQALEPSIQAAEMDMETETLSTRDGSSANSEDMQIDGDEVGEDMRSTTGGVAERMKSGVRSRNSENKRGKRKMTTSGATLRRSKRTARDRSSSVETDEFGFTVRPHSSTSGSVTVESATYPQMTTGPSRKKPLARTKPPPRPTQGIEEETESSDEERVKKRRKLRLNVRRAGDELDPNFLDDNGHLEQAEAMKRRGAGSKGRGMAKRNTGIQRSERPQAVPATRSTRASTQKLASTRESRIIKKGGGG